MIKYSGKEPVIRVRESLEFLHEKGVIDPEIGIVLGTGLNDFADRIKDPIVLDYNEIPNMESGWVSDHRGELVYGEYLGKKIVVMAGRFHYYESHNMDKAAYPTRVMASLGIKRLILTNSAGCINESFEAGSFMLINDHINLSGDNPLIGRNIDEFGPRFPDMTFTYDPELRAELKERAATEGIKLNEGVYCMMSGPSFETPAEIRMLRTVGADAVGMSTVPEAIVASHAGIKTIGISFLSNMAAGVTGKPITGEEVSKAAAESRVTFAKVLDLAITL
ncbi:MAG: purine-nucleoside phosphorylase [Mogibacterium sp.]|nr:purine-nucleoside phosphorylase [Mogibacterium sp.]